MEARVTALEHDEILMASPPLGGDSSTWSPFAIEEYPAAVTADIVVNGLGAAAENVEGRIDYGAFTLTG